MNDITIPIHTGKADASYLRSLTDTLKQIQTGIKTLGADVETVTDSIPAPFSFVDQVRWPAGFGLTTSTKTLTSGTSFAVYFGKAPKDLTSLDFKWEVTTAATVITWAEFAIATGNINFGGNSTLTPVWYKDVAADIGALGIKTTTITGKNIPQGTGIWLVCGHAVGGVTGVVRSYSSNTVQSGVQCAAVIRPSTNLNIATSFTIEAAATTAIHAVCNFGV